MHVLVLILSWLIPGYGFMHHGRWARGIYFFITLQATFLIGAWLRGSVLLPDFNMRSEGFNIMTILTFVTQIFNGGLSILSLLPEIGGPAILPYDETNQWSDLGSFYLLISGGMNYFVLTATWDYFYGSKAAGPVRASLEAQS